MFEFRKIEGCNMCGADSSQQKKMGVRLNASQGWNPSGAKGITAAIWKCKHCGLIYCNPMPLPVDASSLYNIDPETYWKQSYFDITEKEISNKRSIIEQVVSITNGMKLLDVGAGVGKQIKIYSDLGIDCVGIESSKQFYDYAIGKMKIDAACLQNTSIYDSKFPVDHFDFVNCSAVLEHVTDPSAAIEKMMSWLKPGGILFISVPYSGWLIAKTINLVYQLKGNDFVTNLSPMHPPFHLFEFGTKSFKMNAEKNKFNIVKIQHVVCETFLPKIIDPFFKWVMKKTNTGMEINVWLTKP